jgi:hypothetical protein
MTLGGAIFIWNGISQDYCFLESIQCLIDLCHEVSIVYGGNDGTVEAVEQLASVHQDSALILNNITQQEWDAQQGREKLSYFMNEALACLDTDWAFSLQADEIIHERSFYVIRQAIELPVEAVVAKRYNLWRDPLSMLNVEQERKPCSTEIIRLARTKYRAYSDGEHLAVPSIHVYDGREESIEVYHVGYIRDPVKMVVKSRNMLVDIFNIGMDARIGEKFDSRNFPFTGPDIIPVPMPLPKYIQAWCQERYPNIQL